jgi:PAS domain S-box-containing protein
MQFVLVPNRMKTRVLVIFSRVFLLAILLIGQSRNSVCEESWEFEAFLKPDGTPLADVREIAIDPTGAVWLGSWGEGFHRIFEAEWREYNEKATVLPDDWVKGATVDTGGGVWAGTGEGLCYFRNAEAVACRAEGLADIDVNRVRALRNGGVVATTHVGEVFLVHPPDDVTQSFQCTRIGVETDLNGLEPCDVLELPDGRLWVSVFDGPVFEYDGEIWKKIFGHQEAWVLIPSFSGDDAPHVWLMDQHSGDTFFYDGASWNQMSSLELLVNHGVVGPKNHLWAASHDGVYRLERGQWRIVDLGRAMGAPNIHAIRFDQKGRVWLGTNAGLILGANPAWQANHRTTDGRLIRYLIRGTAPGENLLGVDEDSRVVEYDSGLWKPKYALASREDFLKLWLAPQDGLLWGLTNTHTLAFSTETGEVKHHLPLPTLTDVVETEWFRASCGTVWLLSAAGAFQLEGESWVPIPADPAYSRQETYVALELNPGEFFVGVYNGIEHWKDGRFIDNPAQQQGFSKSSGIHSLFQSQSGAIYCGTYGSSLFVYDDTTFSLFPRESDLFSPMIENIYEARDGTVWIAFRHTGVASFRDDRWVNYATQHGLPNSSVLSIHEAPDSGIWLSTRNAGILRHQPDQAPPETTMNASPTTIAPHGVGVFSFSGRDAWNETTPDTLLYSWRIRPTDLDNNGCGWSAFTAEKYATPPPLDAGDYFFEVRASDGERNIDQSPAQSHFRVELPLWRRPAFFLPLGVAALVALGALAAAWWLRNRKMRLEQERMRHGEWLHAVIMNTPGAVYQHRPDTAKGLLFISEAIKDITGHAPSDFLEEGLTFAGIIHPDERTRVEETRRAQLSAQGWFEVEYRVCHAAGRISWVSDRGRLSKWVDDEDLVIDGILVDITTRREMEEALRLSHETLEEKVRQRTKELSAVNEQLRTEIAEKERAKEGLARNEELLKHILEAVPVGIALSESGCFRWGNRHLAEMLEIPLEEIPGRPIDEFHADPLEARKIRHRIARETNRGKAAEVEICSGPTHLNSD